MLPVTLPYPTPMNQIVKQNPKLMPLLLEDVLNLELVPIDKPVGLIEIDDCLKCLRLNDQEIELLISKVPSVAFNDLFLEASSMHTSGKNFITGLRISYGVSQSKPTTVSPVFQPLCLELEDSNRPDGNYIVAKSGKMYTFGDTTFIPVDPAEMNLRTDKYRNAVTFWNEEDSEYKSFETGVNVESLIFPFQTIFTLINDNDNIENIFLYNAIRQNEDAKQGIRNCVLLSPFTALGNTLKGKYANRSHLCPPDCTIIKYSVYEYKR